MADDESVFTAEMLGVFLVVGDGALLAGLLWTFGAVGWLWPATTTVVTVALFAGWAIVRWRRIGQREAHDPTEALKRRYAAGELTDEEFEAKLETLMDSDSPDLRRRDRDTEAPD